MTNDQVLTAWLTGRTASAGNLSTDGRNLWSYRVLIARYGWSDDNPIVYNYRSKGQGVFISRTTSKHVTLAELAAIRILRRQPTTIHPHGETNDDRRTEAECGNRG